MCIIFMNETFVNNNFMGSVQVTKISQNKIYFSNTTIAYDRLITDCMKKNYLSDEV